MSQGNYKPKIDNRYTYTEKNSNIALKIVIKSKGKRIKKKKKNYKNNLRTINKMAVSTYLSVMTLTVNGLNASIKKHRMAEINEKKKYKIHIYAAYNRLTSDLKTHTVR